MSKKVFVGACIDFGQKGGGQFIESITDHPESRLITKATFQRHADLHTLPRSHPFHPAEKMRGVQYLESYHKSKLPSGKPVYYFVWSGIEHLFVDRPFYRQREIKNSQ